MSFIKLSLQQMAMVKVAIMLWNKDDIYLVTKLYFMKKQEKGKKWQNIEATVLERVKQLSVPESCRENISRCVRPIGMEILQWIEQNESLFTVDDYINYPTNRAIPDERIIETLMVPHKLFWTMEGIVDGKKTTEVIVKEENLNIKKRYLSACTYCFEDDIFELWNRFSEQDKLFVSQSHANVQPFMVRYWTHVIKGEEAKIIEIMGNGPLAYHCLAINAIYIGNFEAVKFFFSKLTARRGIFLQLQNVKEAHEIRLRPGNIWCFLLSQIPENIEISKDYHSNMLYSFLRWPWQSLFMDIVKRIGNSISVHLSYGILHEIANLEKQDFTDYNYQELFEEYWLYISDEHKRNVINVVLDEATAEECSSIFLTDNWLAKPFLRHIYLSSLPTCFTQFVLEFKKRILRHRSKTQVQRERQIWDSLFDSMDRYMLRNDEEAMEVNESSSDKRLLLSQRIVEYVHF